MEYQVPQFIEVEDKIIGPLTLRQFIYLAGTVGLCVVFFFYLNLVVAILLTLPVAALGGALAFYKVNEKPFIEILEAGFQYLLSAKLFLWQHRIESRPEVDAAETAAKEAAAAAALAARATPRITRGKLSDLAWSLDIKPTDDARPTP